MAQTKRKRRSKHRGTAAGTIEARGKTGKTTGTTGRQGARGKGGQGRVERVPTWKSATIRGGFASLLLFLFMSLGVGGDIQLGAAVGICLIAMAIYVPLGYWTDVLIYNRRLKKTQAKAREKG